MNRSLVHVMGALSERGAGVARAVWEMTAALAAAWGAEFDVHLAGLSDPEWNGSAPIPVPPGLKVHPFRAVGPSPPAFSPSLRRLMQDAGQSPCVVHSHGLWLHPNWSAAGFARSRRAPLVISPHGMLCPWSFRHSRWKKLPIYHLIERRNLFGAACILASSRKEARDIAAFGFGVPIATIPFGLDMAQFPDPAVPSASLDQAWAGILRRHSELADKRIVLFLGRIHPVKAPEQLVGAFEKALGNRGEFHLVFAGPDAAGTLSALTDLARRGGIAPRVTFTGAVSGDEKTTLLQRSAMLVLCSHNENFGYVVPEALASGIPVVTSDQTPWGEIVVRGCGWSYPHGVEGLASALSDAAAVSTDELTAMGTRGRTWIESEFAWPEVARRLMEMYRWLLDGGSPPSFVEKPS